ncbi:polysaccharide export outer membrane protein [Inhella inkyongensis]|uniref:Polysaccharide export outer membrane protein n=1 Tax=Inhella inkyongensis TaxID=392593 RepID=A0A840S706_9BURK|nr:polysaccharide export protein EpsE [Inhella inkyongensis]MBB5204361.1 polysaccharide export outer membrane protein [Inhella inkyongensis]
MRVAFFKGILLALLTGFVAFIPAYAQGKAVGEYKLGAGDVVRVMVYQNADLTIEARVSEAGLLSYPLLGNVKVGGLSASAAEQLIANGLKDGSFVKQPQVTLTVLQVRAHMVNVLGHLNRPGRYPLEMGGMRVADLLSVAGGTTAVASEVVVVSGTRDGKPFRVELDLPSLFEANSKTQDVELMNGDTLWVDRARQIYIYGEVQRPGAMRLERGMTLMQALAAGGGTTQRGTEKGIRVHRKDDKGQVQALNPPMEALLQDGDVVFVRESLF